MCELNHIYFRKKDGNFYTEFTKEHFYSFERKSKYFIKFCEKLDIPYIKDEYQKLLERYPDRPISGRYLSKMKLCAFKNLTFKDSIYDSYWR